jgi:tRNA pseudouridine55 synthase
VVTMPTARDMTATRDATPRAPKVVWRALHGVLLVDKPVGPTSTAALAQAKRLWRADKAGHTGTLDPMASGVLPLCFGAATKFAQWSLDADKTYVATLRLGQTREGGDLEGRVLRERDVVVSDQALQDALRRFTGPIDQTPPMHSALKHEGQPLYALARRGLEVERAARRVHVHRISLVHREDVKVCIEVHCSKGTYIRTLAEDIGEVLGCGAHLTALQRTASGAHGINAALGLDDAKALDEAQRDARLLPVDSLLMHAPSIALNADEAGRFLTGLRRRVAHPDAPLLRVYGAPLDAPQESAPQGAGTPSTTRAGVAPFLGAGKVVANELIALRLLSPIEVEQALRPPH